MRSTGRMTRRRLLGAGAAGAWLGMVVPRHTVARSGQTPPSEKINVAGIGVGGMGHGDINAVAGLGTNIVALCDVDSRRAGGTFQQFPQAKQYRDFRKMLDEMDRQIDAVVVATPDHVHAVAAMAAIKRGKTCLLRKAPGPFRV